MKKSLLYLHSIHYVEFIIKYTTMNKALIPPFAKQMAPRFEQLIWIQGLNSTFTSRTIGKLQILHLSYRIWEGHLLFAKYSCTSSHLQAPLPRYMTNSGSGLWIKVMCVTSSPKNFLATMQSLAVPCWSDLEAEDDHPGNLPDPHWIRINFCVVNWMRCPSLFVTIADPMLINEWNYCEACMGWCMQTF